MPEKKNKNRLKLVETATRINRGQNKFMDCPVPAVVPDYTIPSAFNDVKEKYGLPDYLPEVLKSTLVAKILKISRPTAIKILKEIDGVSVGTNLKRRHLRVHASFFLAYLKRNMNGNSAHENAGN